MDACKEAATVQVDYGETQFGMNDKTEAVPGARTKKLSLDNLIPEKAAVSTSLGILYVRPIYISDSNVFESDDAAELGRAVVRKVASRMQDKRDITPLADEDLDALLDTDFEVLAPVVAEKNHWDALPVGAGLVDLGNAARRRREQELERLKKQQDELRTSIGSSYAFLGNSALEQLQEQMVGLSNIRHAMSAAESIKAAMEASDVWGRSMLDASSEPRRATDELLKSSRSTVKPELFFPRTDELSLPFSPPSPEDTVLGRATLEAAESSREAVRRMDALVEVVGGLNQTLVEHILPTWFANAKSDQLNAEQAFKQAGKSLRWTQLALIASVVVSIWATWWQISVTREVDQESLVSQRTSDSLLQEQLVAQRMNESLLREQLVAQRTNESLLREQLVSQQKLTEQQSLEMKKLQKLLEKQSIGADQLQAMLKMKLSAPARQ